MSNTPPQIGRFVWHELYSTDKDASRAFYSGLFGWEWKDEDMGPIGIYSMAHTGETYHGGLMDPPQPGIPSHWTAYVEVPDVDEACTQATELGGSVMVPPMDIPKVGRFAALRDPAGAVIYPFKGANPAQPETPSPAPAGYFCWNELLTTATAASEKFYTKIFGWSTEASEMPSIGKYWVFKRGDQMEGGMMTLPEQAAAEGTPPHWLAYVSVADVDATVSKAVELGARVYCQPTDIPRMGRFAVMADPTGAVFAAFQYA